MGLHPPCTGLTTVVWPLWVDTREGLEVSQGHGKRPGVVGGWGSNGERDPQATHTSKGGELVKVPSSPTTGPELDGSCQ